MAITKHDSTQPYLENPEPSHSGSNNSDFRLPIWNDVNVEDVEFILDVDLDELDVFFEDKSNPYTVEEVADDYSLLVDMFVDRVIGVVINKFYSRQLPEYPEFISALRYATIIAGDSVQSAPPATSSNRESSNSGVDIDFLTSKRDALAGVARMIDAE